MIQEIENKGERAKERKYGKRRERARKKTASKGQLKEYSCRTKQDKIGRETGLKKDREGKRRVRRSRFGEIW